MSDLRTGFFQECDDLLETLAEGLSALEESGPDDEVVNAMFRAVHSIKGGAGAFALDHLVEFSHAFENLLDDMRAGKQEVTQPVMSLLFASGDHLNHLVDQYREEIEPDPASGHSILGDLRLLTGEDGSSETQSEIEAVLADSFAPITLDLGDAAPLAFAPHIGAGNDDSGFQIRFKAQAELYRTGNDPALLFRALGELGQLDIRIDDDAVPPLEQLDLEKALLSWELDLAPNPGTGEAEIREVFEFVEGLAEIAITPRQQDMTEVDIAPIPSLEENAPVAKTDAPAQAPDVPGPGKEGKKPTSKSGQPAKAGASRSSAARQTIRVELQKVDRLINLVGELVISEAMLRQSMSELELSSHNAIDDAMAQLKQLSGILQESVMTIRAQPVRGLFQRMSRIAREAGRETGKELKVVTVGDSTELDKIVTERLVEPLTHMIRNAVDHGLEPLETRTSAGKPARGTITLSAEHRSGRVVITLSDDGGGIDRARVRAVAEEKGLISPEDDLVDSDVDNLLFMPGFSTNSEVSTLSGRGVGMDVVRSEVMSLGGRVSLQSSPGVGTSAIISLPLTLAVLDGMLVSVADETVVVPTAVLRETYRVQGADIHEFGEADRVLRAHDALIPLIDLGSALGFRAPPPDISNGSVLLIETNEGRQTALVVDEIFGQREVVIKGLEQNFRQIPGIAAATILGDGNIALIVDTDQLIDPAKTRAISPPPREGHPHTGAAAHV